jgi:predicted RNA-binding protein with PUA-like domain
MESAEEGSVAYWLMKSEPDVFGIEHLARRRSKTTPWTGVRNYQARNYMRSMTLGDRAFFYHSSCPEPGIAGIVEVVKLAYLDKTQFDPASEYFDPKVTKAAPRWFHVDVKLVTRTRLVGLPELREHSALADMIVLRRGNRLSITPVSEAEWRYVYSVLLDL